MRGAVRIEPGTRWVGPRALVALVGALCLAAGLGSSARATTLTVCASGCDYSTIQAAVTAASSGTTITVAAGTYAESVSISKPLTLDGAQAGVDARSRSGAESTVDSISISSSDVVVDGFSFASTSPATVQQLFVNSASTLSGVVVRNNRFGGYSSEGIFTSNAGDIDVEQNLFDAPSGSDGEGIQLTANSDAGRCSGSTIENNEFVGATTNGGSDVNLSCTGSGSSNVTVSGNTTSGNSDGASFAGFSGVSGGIEISGNSGTTDGSSIFFFGGVSGSATIEDNTFTSNSGSGVSIHEGSEVGTSDPANTGTFTISDNTLTGSAHGISVSAGGLGAGGAVVAHGNNLSGNGAAGLANASSTTVDATGNWWGALAGPGTVTGVTTTPWCTASSCSTTSAGTDLTALSLSSGTLSPAFSSSVTAYTASVSNGTTAVTASTTAVPGATVATTGGSSLAVGANTVAVTVTSLDGSATKTYTVTVTRAPAAQPATTTTTTTTTTSAATTTAAATTTSQPTQVATVANEAQSAAATPGRAGSVAVVVAAPAAATGPAATPVSVSLTWAPQAFQVPVTVQVTPQPQAATATSAPAPVAGGFSVGSTVVQVNVTTDAGQAVTQFAAPLVLHLSSFAPGQVPAYSHDGTTWTTIPRLGSPALPAGQQDGYYVEPDGSVDIYTRHATLFGLLLDARAPSRPVVAARLAGGKLRLVVHARDNVAVASYRVLVNGKLVKRTVHPGIVLTARPGRVQVVAVDRAGNRSAVSRAVVVRRLRGPRLAIRR